MPTYAEVQAQMEARGLRLEALRRSTEEANEREVGLLVEQIREARKEADTVLSRLNYLADELRTRSRRVATDASASLVVFANAHLRFAGAAIQGMKRTASMDRFLDKSKADREEAKRRDQQVKEWAEARKARQKVEKLTLPTDDAFEELYGEVVSDA